MRTDRRYILTVGTALLCGTAGCLSPSNRNTSAESTLEITHQRSTEPEGTIRFIDGEDVVVEEPLNLDGGTQQSEVKFPQDVRQVTPIVEFHTPEEPLHGESVPAGVPEYYIAIRSNSVDVVWAEN